MATELLMLVGFVAFMAIIMLFFFVRCYKKCPSDKIMIVFGRLEGEQPAMCYAGGAAFVWPVIQDHGYIDLAPMTIDVKLLDARSKQNKRVSVAAQFIVAVSKKPMYMIAAAERLLGLKQDAIQSLAHDIIIGQMRLVITKMDVEELDTDTEKFVDTVNKSIESKLQKIGVELIDMNVADMFWTKKTS